ncbi:uncharacterized protein DNG_08312 [Cephalotrichum gorgonifer]|uniref:Gag1-like clamp domain-containing protein n=1 Tax=Cephalotrichum gorgonifer TaxID=2041049 RepID=A0AAE8SY86_9PEZI|nr:uncharacterized protein DNG_08312 [Cephalotrichum gorgonifer]
MFFSDLYKSPKGTFAKFRHVQTPAPDYGDADLVSKDKIKQKVAVRRYLDEKVRSDWRFEWPPQPSASAPAIRPDVAASLESAQATDSAPAAEQKPQESTAEAALNGSDTPQLPPSEAASPPLDAVEPSLPAASQESKEADHVPGVSDAPPACEPAQPAATNGTYDNGIDDGNESDDDTSSTYSTFSEDEEHFRPRLEWESELSDDDDDDGDAAAAPFRFESPDTVGETIRADALSKKEQRRRAARDEAAWNEGVACFEARRNAWTGARTVRLKKKPASPASGLASLSPRRLFFRSTSPTSPLSSSPNDRRSGESPAALSDTSDPHKDMSPPLTKNHTKSSSLSVPPAAPLPIETLIPIAPPLLPPANAMRASISPSVYPSIYDKLVTNGLTPSCPVNLSDMIRACVKKRKGPENAAPPRRMSLGIGDGAIRRSMQKFFGHGNAA